MRIVIDKLRFSIVKDDAFRVLTNRIELKEKIGINIIKGMFEDEDYDPTLPTDEPELIFGNTSLTEKEDATKSHFKHNYDVYVNSIKIGYLEFTTYGLVDKFAYFTLYNDVLYSDKWLLYKQFISDTSLCIRHISRLDIALDVRTDLTQKYLSIITNRGNEIVVCGSVVKDEERGKYAKWQRFICGGSYDEPLYNKSLYLSTHDNSLLMRIYDKRIEIEEHSGKKYADLDGDTDFFRCEICVTAKQLNRHENDLTRLLDEIENPRALLALHRKYMYKLFRYTPSQTKKRLTLI